MKISSLITVFILSVSFLYAQPCSFEITGSFVGYYDGTYVNSGRTGVPGNESANDCICYDKTDGTASIFYAGSVWGQNDNTCDKSLDLIADVSADAPSCNILDATWTEGTIINAMTCPETEPIPTLGEWGLISLMLSFLIVGTVAVRNRVFKVA